MRHTGKQPSENTQVLEPQTSQLSAAIFALLAAIIATHHNGPGLAGYLYRLNFLRWGLEGELLLLKSAGVVQCRAVPPGGGSCDGVTSAQSSSS